MHDEAHQTSIIHAQPASGRTRRPRAWVVSADMGYGHRRAVHPLRDIAEGGIINAGSSESTPPAEQKLWERLLHGYEAFSRARSLPFIGRPLFSILDTLLRIPSFYPMRNLSSSTFQVALLDSLIKKGLCSGIMEKVRSRHLPMITSFFAPAIAADRAGHETVYCLICDADLNRVWVAREPWESRITYFAPCGKAAQRLKAYGVPEQRIFLTGFPFSRSLLGGRDLPVLKEDLGQRLFYLDPSELFRQRHGPSVEHFLGKKQCIFRHERVLTVTFSVGGAGAQTEVGMSIARSLKKSIHDGRIRLNLAAGVKPSVRDSFQQLKSEVAPDSPYLQILHADNLDDYFDVFDGALRSTDILWTKPSELSFYCGLGIPIVTTPAIGSQEQFNRRWLLELGAGIRQENPDYTDQWLFDYLRNGLFADAAWSGFLKARKLGIYNILDILSTGVMPPETSAILR